MLEALLAYVTSVTAGVLSVYVGIAIVAMSVLWLGSEHRYRDDDQQLREFFSGLAAIFLYFCVVSWAMFTMGWAFIIAQMVALGSALSSTVLIAVLGVAYRLWLRSDAKILYDVQQRALELKAIIPGMEWLPTREEIHHIAHHDLPNKLAERRALEGVIEKARARLKKHSHEQHFASEAGKQLLETSKRSLQELELALATNIDQTNSTLRYFDIVDTELYALKRRTEGQEDLLAKLSALRTGMAEATRLGQEAREHLDNANVLEFQIAQARRRDQARKTRERT